MADISISPPPHPTALETRQPFAPFKKRVLREVVAPPGLQEVEVAPLVCPMPYGADAALWCVEISQAVLHEEMSPLRLAGHGCEGVLQTYFTSESLRFAARWQVYNGVRSQIFAHRIMCNELAKTLSQDSTTPQLRATIVHRVSATQCLLGCFIPTYWKHGWTLAQQGIPQEVTIVYTTPEHALANTSVPEGCTGGYTRCLVFCWLVLGEVVAGASEEGVKGLKGEVSSCVRVAPSGMVLAVCNPMDLLPQYILSVEDAEDSDEEDVVEKAMRDARKYAVSSQWVMGLEGGGGEEGDGVGVAFAVSAERDFRDVLFASSALEARLMMQGFTFPLLEMQETEARNAFCSIVDSFFAEEERQIAVFHSYVHASLSIRSESDDNFTLITSLSTMLESISGIPTSPMTPATANAKQQRITILTRLLKTTLQGKDTGRVRIVIASLFLLVTSFTPDEGITKVKAGALCKLIVSSIHLFTGSLHGETLVEAFTIFALTYPSYNEIPMVPLSFDSDGATGGSEANMMSSEVDTVSSPSPLCVPTAFRHRQRQPRSTQQNTARCDESGIFYSVFSRVIEVVGVGSILRTHSTISSQSQYDEVDDDDDDTEPPQFDQCHDNSPPLEVLHWDTQVELGPTVEEVLCHALRCMGLVRQPLACEVRTAKLIARVMNLHRDCVALLQEGFGVFTQLLSVRPTLLSEETVLSVVCDVCRRLSMDEAGVQYNALHVSVLQCMLLIAPSPAAVKERLCADGGLVFLEMTLRRFSKHDTIIALAVSLLELLVRSFTVRLAVAASSIPEGLSYLQSSSPKIVYKIECIRDVLSKAKSGGKLVRPASPPALCI